MPAFPPGIFFECDIAHRRSEAVLCMLFKIRCHQMYPHCGALPGPYVQVQVTRSALVTHRYTYSLLRSRTSLYHRTFISLSLSLCNDLDDPVCDGVILACFKSRANAFFWASCSQIFFSYCFQSLFFHSMGWYFGSGIFGLIGF